MATSSPRKLFRPKQNEGEEKDNDHLLQGDSPTSAQTLVEQERRTRARPAGGVGRQHDAIAGQILHHSRLADEAMATLAANVLRLQSCSGNTTTVAAGCSP
jgi:hypothetical protein